MVQWLLSECTVLGWHVQNWMWAIPSALILYGAAMLLIRGYQTPKRL